MMPPTDDFRLETLVAIDAVKRALPIARRGVGAEDITAKGGRDLVTVTDVAVEDAVRGIVAKALGTECAPSDHPGRRSTRHVWSETPRGPWRSQRRARVRPIP